MKVQSKSGSQERRILIGMIVDRVALGQIAPKWENGLMRSKFSNLLATWCVDYFNKYGKAPGKHIEGIFASWAEKRKDKETVNLIEKFLSGLSNEYKSLAKESNSKYVVDIAAKHFDVVRLEKTAELLQGYAAKGDIDKAFKKLNSLAKIELGTGAGIDLFQDPSAVKRAFENNSEPLIKLPGAYGKFLGHHFERDAFVGIMAPEKRGKSWYLMDLAMRGMEQRRRVAYFQAGDLSEHQIIKRIATRCAKRPLTEKTVLYPVSIEKIKGEPFAQVELEEREYKGSLSWKKAVEKMAFVMKTKVKSKESYFKLSVHANSTLNVQGINNILDQWERAHNWIPDIVVIDYADIMAPPSGYFNESRDVINATWNQLRSLSQSRHCLVITATQAKASSYKAVTMTRSDFAEDKRKFAHVTSMLALNQTEEEKENGVIRVNVLALREGEYYESRCVHLAGCLAIANPVLRSAL